MTDFGKSFILKIQSILSHHDHQIRRKYEKAQHAKIGLLIQFFRFYLLVYASSFDSFENGWLYGCEKIHNAEGRDACLHYKIFSPYKIRLQLRLPKKMFSFPRPSKMKWHWQELSKLRDKFFFSANIPSLILKISFHPFWFRRCDCFFYRFLFSW